jgi:protein SCO1/2
MLHFQARTTHGLTRRGLLLAGTALAAGCAQKPAAAFKGADLSDANYGRDFRLKDRHGQVRTLADYRGKVVLLHFGFTQCPDACPMQLARAVEVRGMLGERGREVQVLFVTLDPERDTPELMANYIAAFDPGFIGLSGDPEETRAAADQFKVFYRKVPTGSTYTLDHSTLAYGFDPQGRLRVGLRLNQRAEYCAHDLRQLFA